MNLKMLALNGGILAFLIVYYRKTDRKYAVMYYSLLVTIFYIYNAYYHKCLRDILKSSKVEFIYGPMKTTERYAITKRETSDIVYESSYNTHTFGNDDSVIRPSWTTETKYKTEKNKREAITFAEDLIIGDYMMDDEYTSDKIEYSNIDWHRGPVINYTEHGQKNSEFYLYPTGEIKIVSERQHDYYDIKLISNDPRSFDQQFDDAELFYNKAITLTTTILCGAALLI